MASATSSTFIEPGTDFAENFTLAQELGKGNFSVVRAAKNDKTGEHVAVKVMKKSQLTDQDTRELKHETAILASLDHANIIQFRGFYQDVNHFYIVTELLNGGELFDKIVEKEFYTEGDAQGVLRKIGAAIKYCHDQNVVHRDLKPENILLSSKEDDAILKIADFGFAKKAEGDGLSTSLGTPGYVAPEILKKSRYDTSVDMWAIGIIMYILLCGYPPFYDENQPALFSKIKKGEFQFDSPYWDEISEGAKELISNLLCVDTSRRYSIDSFLNHPWMAEDQSGKDLTPAIQELRSYLNRRRLRAGVHATMAMQKMRQIAASATDV